MHPWTTWCLAHSVHQSSLSQCVCKWCVWVCVCVRARACGCVCVRSLLTRVLPVTALLIRGFFLSLMSADRSGLPCQHASHAHTHTHAHLLPQPPPPSLHTHAHHLETRCPTTSACRQTLLNVSVLYLKSVCVYAEKEYSKGVTFQ